MLGKPALASGPSVERAALRGEVLGQRSARWDDQHNPISIYDGLNAVTVSWNLQLASDNLDEIFAQVTASGTTRYLRDGLSSTVAVTTTAAGISANDYYSPYGDSTTTGTVTTSFQFTGRENDGSTGLYYYRARYYSPQFGRFISEDPLELGGGTNFYAYVGGNPISYRDPLGMWSVTAGGYAGVGTEVTVGYVDGHSFLTDRFGFGIGGGITFDPRGGDVPGGTAGTSYGGVLSVSGQAGANIGPVGGNVELVVERNYQTHESNVFGGVSADLTSDKWGLHVAASVRGQVTIYWGSH